MNRRQSVKALTGDEVCALEHLWIYAHRRGSPLNTFITVMTDGFDLLSPQQKADARGRILNNLGQFARRKGFDVVYLWTREARPYGGGEHWHILLFVPVEHYKTLRLCAKGWLPLGEIDIRRADYRVGQDGTGKKRSVLLYVAKQMSPQASYKRPWRRTRGGAVVGARWGCSRSLVAEKRAQLDWLAEKRRRRKSGSDPVEHSAAMRAKGGKVMPRHPPAPTRTGAATIAAVEPPDGPAVGSASEGAASALNHPATGDRSWPADVPLGGPLRPPPGGRHRGRRAGNCVCRRVGRGGPRGPPADRKA